MKRIRNWGIQPLNPGEISDHQLAPSNAFRPASDLKSVSTEVEEQKELLPEMLQRRLQSG